jgi:hypothetical protein|tara:strand:+ start:450 stop:635 length:186 start_codon:yes stop_codon:yes gene_type:complete
MAKFSRYDPKNKKRNKHKSQSQNKDLRIRDVEESGTSFKLKGHQVDYVLLDGLDDYDVDES